MKKKVLMILTREPYPIDTGRKHILAQTIEFLKEEFEIKLLIFSPSDLNKDKYLKNNINNIERLYFPSKAELIKNLFSFHNKSLQEKLFFSEKSKKLIYNNIYKYKPDIIYTDMIRTAQYIENLYIKDVIKIVDLDDLLSIRYKRFLNSKEDNILGTFEFLFPSIFRKFSEKFLKEYLLKKEIELIKKREIEISRKFDISFLVSKKEAKLLSKIIKKQVYINTQAIPQRNFIYHYTEENNFVFIGNMLTPQNFASLKMIVNEILPLFEFEYKLFVVGSYDKKTEKLVKNNKNIQLLGFVENLENILRKTKLALMPISFGTGIKTKILDCMSYGIPVLTNNVGNEGLSTEHFKNIILFEKEEIKNKEILKIIRNKNLLENIAKNGYNYILENHNFQKLKSSFLNVIKMRLK